MVWVSVAMTIFDDCIHVVTILPRMSKRRRKGASFYNRAILWEFRVGSFRAFARVDRQIPGRHTGHGVLGLWAACELMNAQVEIWEM